MTPSDLDSLLAMWSRLYDLDAVNFYYSCPMGMRRTVFEYRRNHRKVTA